ncbi:hypothetical protein [Nonomuraea dietziae]
MLDSWSRVPDAFRPRCGPHYTAQFADPATVHGHLPRSTKRRRRDARPRA